MMEGQIKKLKALRVAMWSAAAGLAMTLRRNLHPSYVVPSSRNSEVDQLRKHGQILKFLAAILKL